MANVPKWKRFETRVAQRLGGRRIPVTGIDRADRDCETPLLWVQCKFRKSLPPWLWEWVSDICAGARTVDKSGVLVLGIPGQDTSEALVVMRLVDFEALHGRVFPTTEERKAG